MEKEDSIHKKIMSKIKQCKACWYPPTILGEIPHGDMPGDKVEINEDHIVKANTIFPKLLNQLELYFNKTENSKVVVAVCGGSGVGKSEIASLLSFYLNQIEIGSYVMSGDNYPYRIPEKNDKKRLEVYEDGGKENLISYLGSSQEIDFDLVESIIKKFKAGDHTVSLKRMGRTEDELWYDDVDMTDTQVLIIEWTHSNSDCFDGVDIPILLNSTPQETLEHRKSRNRDGAVDSPFTTMVLEIEQELLNKQAHKAQIIVSKQGTLLSYEEYCILMKLDRG